MKDYIDYKSLKEFFSINIEDLQEDIDKGEIKEIIVNGEKYIEVRSLAIYTMKKISDYSESLNSFSKLVEVNDDEAVNEYLRLFDEKELLYKLYQIFQLRYIRDFTNGKVSLENLLLYEVIDYYSSEWLEIAISKLKLHLDFINNIK